ncbi:MAG TPA: 30S ribosomal protein S17 [Candidatus Hydrogenedentes bacterium]|nr:30S ribosomal protein S17 [Candidatus Hydrogenedentota bacterium]
MDALEKSSEDTRGRRKERVGVVTSNAMQKTITISVEGAKTHSLYSKTLKRTKKFKAHDERGEAKVGDIVRIRETRPLSKTKCWRLVEVIKRAE